MLIKSYELKNNLKSKVNVYLLYGENSELIEEVINRDIKTLFSKNLYIYEESEILSDKDNFELSLFNKSFFENEKLIIINRSTDKILELVKNILEKNNSDIKIILKAGILEKKSRLRNFFEKSKESFIIPFYEDNHQTLQNLALNFFKTNKIKISTQNINFILEKSKGSRVNLKNELIKIKNFSQNKTLIEFDDLVKITSSNENYKISELTDQCLAKNRNKTINILNENIASTEDNILILKSFLYKLKRLKKLKEEIETKKNQDQVLSSYKPPIFWKEKDIIKKQLNCLSVTDIKSFINKINELELIVKKNSNLSNEITNNFILETLNNTNNWI
tara:strand:+ start:1742 stop:2743 length:1002 start_codon:yes stop_codon:yes gene_type:complete